MIRYAVFGGDIDGIETGQLILLVLVNLHLWFERKTTSSRFHDKSAAMHFTQKYSCRNYASLCAFLTQSPPLREDGAGGESEVEGRQGEERRGAAGVSCLHGHR